MGRISLQEYCDARQVPGFLAEWDTAENGALSPRDVSYASHRKVWWRCARHHRWEAPVYARTVNRSGCPVCAGRRRLPDENTLASDYPALAQQWHPTRNPGLSPEDVPPGSHRKVWWRCERGHEWQAQVKSRVDGTGCPYCSNRLVLPGENDLATTHPEIAKEWHPTKNGPRTPQTVVGGHHAKVWWRCERGHEWQATILSRTAAGSGCPVCAGKVVLPGVNDLASAAPAVAAEWHPTRNGALTPQSVTPQSNRRAWWLCAHGHAYHAVIAARVQNATGCPYCSNRRVLPGFNDLATTAPQVAAEWHPTRNGELTPGMVTAGSHKRVYWQCAEGHEWRAVIYSRTGDQKCGCPVCAGRRNPAGAARYRAILAETHLSEAEGGF